MNFDIFQMKFLEWTENVIEQKKDDGFAICPFAKKARLDNKIQFIDCTIATSELLEFDKEKYEIGIAWLGDDVNMAIIDEVLELYKAENPDLLYFTSTTDSGYFAKNFTNCVFIQLRGDIDNRREQLHKTKYYDSWPEHYYKIITGH
jgi:hypothetical protein